MFFSETELRSSPAVHKSIPGKRRLEGVTGDWWRVGSVRPSEDSKIKVTTSNQHKGGENYGLDIR